MLLVGGERTYARRCLSARASFAATFPRHRRQPGRLGRALHPVLLSRLLAQWGMTDRRSAWACGWVLQQSVLRSRNNAGLEVGEPPNDRQAIAPLNYLDIYQNL
jgi:hypothetical protein